MKRTLSFLSLRIAVALILAAYAIPASFAQADDKKPAPASKDLPAAKEIIAKFVKAIGGREAYEKVKSQSAKGSMEMAGMKGPIDLFAARPNKMLLEIDLGAAGKFLTGFDGNVAWMKSDAIGPMILEGKQAEQAKEQADFDSVLHDESDYTSMQTIGEEKFDGKDCYKLKLVKKTGQEVTEYYDKATGLLSGFVATHESPFGAAEATTSTTDYKKFGDLMMATKVIVKVGPMQQVITLDSMEFNKVDDSKFELPQDVKAAAEKAKDKN